MPWHCTCRYPGSLGGDCDGSCQHPPPPEMWKDCEECGGEGSIEKWESVSKWSIDPPCAHAVPCQACNGAGGFICEAEGDSTFSIGYRK